MRRPGVYREVRDAACHPLTGYFGRAGDFSGLLHVIRLALVLTADHYILWSLSDYTTRCSSRGSSLSVTCS